MTAVFLDTSGLIALVNADEHRHREAAAAWDAMNRSARPLVTTSVVLIEIGDGLSRLRHRSLAIALEERLRASPHVEIVQSSKSIETEAWELFRRRPDKEWGMTDCVSMTVMRQRGITEVFTLDHHFAQAGFVPLLGDNR